MNPKQPEAENAEVPAQIKLSLWSDDPSSVDLLSFRAIAETFADALLDSDLDPVALGLSGSWGSGKTTVLNLIDAEILQRNSKDAKILVVRADPWRYDPTVGAKESLIEQVLTAIGTEVKASGGKTEKAKNLLVRLGKRIDWAKAIKVAATAAITLQIPKVGDIVDLVKAKPDEPDEVRGLDEFREEFAELLATEDLKHVRAVVVLVDDLDRCLPETVVQSLEAMRLFLDVPKMSFVIAADEERVADAIRTRFASTGTPPEDDRDAEDPARLYLHKIVQTAVSLPALSHFDTQAYLLILQVQRRASDDQLKALIDGCAEIRRKGGSIDDLAEIGGLTFDDELAFASRLTPLLHEKMHGNPRRIKRFLNDLRVREVIAAKRGIELDPTVVAKMMALELVLPTDFRDVLGWLAQGELLPQLELLEQEAGQTAVPSSVSGTASESDESAVDDKTEFSQAMIRWAKLTPALTGLDLAPYLTLAASFAGVTLVDEQLPERLRDISANLLSGARTEQASVKDAELDSLGDGDVKDLMAHIGRTLRDQPTKQKAGVMALLRLCRRKPHLVEQGAEAMRMLSARHITIATPLLFLATDPAEVRAVLSAWREQVTDGPISRALDNAIKQRTS